MKVRQRAAGMTLLELLVALTIMSLSIALLYRAIGGSAQGVARITDAQAAAQLAESLLDNYSVIEPSGVNEQSRDGRFSWRVQSQPYMEEQLSASSATRLHHLNIAIDMPSGRVWELSTLRLQRPFQPGERSP